MYYLLVESQKLPHVVHLCPHTCTFQLGKKLGKIPKYMYMYIQQIRVKLGGNVKKEGWYRVAYTYSEHIWSNTLPPPPRMYTQLYNVHVHVGVCTCINAEWDELYISKFPVGY